MRETEYWHRTDTLEEKLKLLRAAVEARNFRLARALTESLKTTVTFAQQEEEALGAPLLRAESFGRVEQLPQPWREWARGWSYYKVLALDETVAVERSGEPVEVVAAFRADQAVSLLREVRVARMDQASGELREVPCQVSEEIRRGAARMCRLTFLAHSPAHSRSSYLVFYGNPDAELTAYPTDLQVSGQGFGLDIENDHYRASLSRQMGQLERLVIKRDHGLDVFAGGEGHGEPPGIDWAHDYVTSGNFQKMRITNWDTCPDYEVIRGPLCVTVRRWGFPYSPIHPVFSPSRMHVFVEYRFYAGLPYFMKQGSMEVIKDLEIVYLRDDEWVFSGYSFTDILWMGPDGKLQTGPVDRAMQDNLWAVGFFNRTSRDAFVGLFLEHEGPPGLKHNGAPTMHYFPHGHVWSRMLYPKATLAAGGVLKQKNAYLLERFSEEGGAAMVERYRHCLLNPLAVREGDLPSGVRPSARGRLARPGEAGDNPIDKRLIWEALRDSTDDQLYTANANVVDLGLIYDIRVRGDVVHVVMTMPHRGRPRYGYFAWGSGGMKQPIRQRLMKLPGVRKVVVEHTWEPPWNPNRLSDAGRKALGI